MNRLIARKSKRKHHLYTSVRLQQKERQTKVSTVAACTGCTPLSLESGSQPASTWHWNSPSCNEWLQLKFFIFRWTRKGARQSIHQNLTIDVTTCQVLRSAQRRKKGCTESSTGSFSFLCIMSIWNFHQVLWQVGGDLMEIQRAQPRCILLYTAEDNTPGKPV